MSDESRIRALEALCGQMYEPWVIDTPEALEVLLQAFEDAENRPPREPVDVKMLEGEEVEEWIKTHFKQD